MPQTRFVLKKALALDKKVIVVVNKIDRPAARCTTYHIFRQLTFLIVRYKMLSFKDGPDT